MLYILPPPRAPNPPSPWDSIMCSGSGGTAAAAQNSDKSAWGGVGVGVNVSVGGGVGTGGKRPPPPRVKLRKLHFKNEDSASGVGDEVDMGRNSKSLSECYFAGKGTAVVLPAASEAQKSNRRNGAGSNIQKHLQSMFYLLPPEETLKMAVKLESVHPVRTRYLVVVSRMGARAEESCLLGIDCNEKTTVGLVLKVLADTAITLDGDGGFSVSVCGRHHIFKPVSVQAMWSALQTLHKVSLKAREQNYFQGGLTHSWVNYYEERIESDRSCLNEWHAMDNLESRRPPSPDSIRTKPTEREETEKVIRSTLKEIMMSVDLDEVTSKYIRSRLEEDLDMDLGEYKSFIDQEMLTILGQMDAPTEIFEHVYLGSEWNASNYEELQRNGVGHILNVTREIDNFFPGTFDYLNVRVYDDEKTDLLKHWDNTYKYISKARKQGSKVLVHCKMGISRSASVVIAYAMKAFDWDFERALQHVKEKRSCIKPNTSFISQLETYQGMLDAMKNKEKLQRSKSETNLKSPMVGAKSELILAGSEPTPIIQSMVVGNLQTTMSGQDLRSVGSRPKSWSPDNSVSNLMVESKSPQGFRSMENLNQPVSRSYFESLKKCVKNNGESYSVSPNQIMHIPNGNVDGEQSLASVKERVSELESKKKLVLNLLPQFENSCKTNEVLVQDSSLNQTTKVGGVVKAETWDPGERGTNRAGSDGTIDDCDLKLKINSASDEKTLTTAGNTVPEVQLRLKGVRKDGDLFSNQLDRVFDREERKQQRVSVVPVENSEEVRNCPSRQSSWSSYDSAVVLGYQGETRDVPSRHSSWGSGDTRTLPSRNSSWGSYDVRDKNTSAGIFPYDKEDIPWHPGTVRRTKQKLEESSCKPAQKTSEIQQDISSSFNNGIIEAVNSTLIQDCSNISCAINTPDIDIIDKVDSRLSVSAPANSTMELIPQDNSSLSKSTSSIDSIKAQYSSVKQYKNFLENQPKILELETNSGLVKNLKKEFEAKTTVDLDRVNQLNIYNTDQTEENKKNRVNSLPSSPTTLHPAKGTSSPTSSDPGEDLGFKELVGKFEKQDRPRTAKTFKTTRYSCFEQTPLISNYNNAKPAPNSEFKRPPVSPAVRGNVAATNVVSTAITKATKKQQQQFGKSHPLARLNIKPRHNNAVYNTM